MQESQAVLPRDQYQPADLAHRIVEVASDRKATDVVMLDLRRQTTFTDFFVVMSGTSTVQIRALAENIKDRLRDDGTNPLHTEGSADDGWVLVDYGPVVVHIFSPDQRSYYGLEQLWSEATVVVRMQ